MQEELQQLHLLTPRTLCTPSTSVQAPGTPGAPSTIQVPRVHLVPTSPFLKAVVGLTIPPADKSRDYLVSSVKVHGNHLSLLKHTAFYQRN